MIDKAKLERICFMRKPICFLLALVFFMPLIILAEENNKSVEKIAVISMQEVFEEYHKSRQATADFQKRAETISIQRKEKMEAIKAKEVEIRQLEKEANDSSLSSGEREKKEKQAIEKYKALREAEEQLYEFSEQAKEQITFEMREQQDKIIAKIRGIVSEYAQKNNLAMVLDNSGRSLNAVEIIIYAKEKKDITSDIIEILNKKNGE
jgi:Skp family chaperone for outer membrane proteins